MMTSTINIYNEDCLHAMRKMKDNEFDLAIVDPPYGIGNVWSKNRRDRFYKEGDLHSYKNDSIPKEDYFLQLFRISKNQIIFGGNYYTRYLQPTNAWIVWDKNRDYKKTFMSEAELAWTSFKKPMRIVNYLWDGAKKCERVEKIHPHQKPILLYKWILQNYATPGSKILDTHLGSGSIAIACYDLGFDLEGYEIDKDYYDAALKRLRIHKSQLKINFISS